MSKKKDLISDEIDEKSLLATIYAKKNPNNSPEKEHISGESEDIGESDSPKIASRRKKSMKGSYSDDFLNRKDKETKRSCVYIDYRLHETVGEIVKVLARKITLGEYIDMVLREHLIRNRDEINSLYRRDREDLINENFE